MGRVFISFLGTSDYSECEYFFRERSRKTKFIQQALIELFCTDFTKEDKMLFLLTEDAKRKNWENGLKEKIAAYNLPAEIRTVDIPVGKSEDEIWKIFEAIYNELHGEDSVILDVTHGFRSLPMLGLVILYYTHYMKNIMVEDIYYGAFEAQDETGRTPIFQLTPFFNLMQWTSAADAFVNYGFSNKLQDMVKKTAVLHRGTKGMADAIAKVTESMSTLRGSDIINGQIYTSCIDKIDKLEIAGTSQTAFKPIISKVREKLDVFKINCPLNFIEAVKWYINCKIIPQALTMMQEGLLTCFMHKKQVDCHNREDRGYASTYLHYNSSRNRKSSKMILREEQIRKYEEWAWNQIDDSPIIVDIADFFASISQLRNDVNHGGFNDGATSYNKIITGVHERLKKLEEIC
ncbi:MAG: TIGR02221 family CRISPR-associated protein, partial [Lachnoclostridium sp.]|nr:TIGR02221 family CRISPR-associated protein [Lachnoclostridium sp.]